MNQYLEISALFFPANTDMPCADLWSYISFNSNHLSDEGFEYSTRTEEKYIEGFFFPPIHQKKKKNAVEKEIKCHVSIIP